MIDARGRTRAARATFSAACSAPHHARGSKAQAGTSETIRAKSWCSSSGASSARSTPRSFVMENVPGMLDKTTRESLSVIDALALIAEEADRHFQAIRRSLARNSREAAGCALAMQATRVERSFRRLRPAGLSPRAGGRGAEVGLGPRCRSGARNRVGSSPGMKASATRARR